MQKTPRSTIIVLLLTTFPIITFEQIKNGIYLGLIEMCCTDSTGRKNCYRDETDSSRKWFHLSYLKIVNDTTYLDMNPITIDSKGDTSYSSSDGGFYYYKGLISTKLDNFRIELTEVSCDYCGQLVERNENGEFIPKKRAKVIIGKIQENDLLLNGYIFKWTDKRSQLESEHYNPNRIN